MFVQPISHYVGNLDIVHLLEHKVAVAFDAHVGKMDDSGITSVLIIMFGKVAALVQHHLPKTSRLDILWPIHDVVAEEEEHRHLGLDELLVFRRIHHGCETRLNGHDGSDVLRIGLPTHAATREWVI